jgi:lipopolysaccharide/colanic/teichoic acid biosynthesis glycosyltransferase
MLHLRHSAGRYHYALTLVLGVVAVVLLPALFNLVWGWWVPTGTLDAHTVSLLVNLMALVTSSLILHQFQQYPQKNALSYLLPTTFITFAVLIGLVWLLRLPYAVKLILFGLVGTLAFLGAQYVILRRHLSITLLTIPLGGCRSLDGSAGITFIPLLNPVLPRTHFSGIVVDLHSRALTDDWERFLAECTLAKIPVYNLLQLNERLTGRVEVHHLAENEFGDLAPSTLRQALKRLFDTIFILFISPVLLPIIAVTALCIMRESPGGAFFIQARMGLGGRTFKMVKFRSMFIDRPGSHFTEDGECHRVTRVGAIIRKYRLDELPQFWNVLRGEMSLIGPRPESLALAKWYQEDVPFFAYRHVVRPGISGWAQVMHGYAAEVDGMKEKLSYDFYYIKHFSFWLDLLIWYKTIRTVLTGFGAR